MNPTCLTAKLIIVLLLVFPSALAAQTVTNTFTSRAEWDAATCGAIVEDEFAQRIAEYLNANNIDPNIDFGPFGLPFETEMGWGTITSFGFSSNENTFINFVTIDRIGLLVDEQQLNTAGNVEQTFFLELDPNLGAVEGFCFQYGSQGFDVDIYDGSTLVESMHAQSSGEDLADFGWINTDGLNVTRIEVHSVPDDPNDPNVNTTTLISSADFSFGEYCPPGESLFDQLTDLRDDVANLLAEESGSDAFFLTRALNRINRMQNGFLWENDNRLSQNGSNLFLNAAGAIVFLQRTRNPQADAIIDDLLSTLGSIVDAEIAYAIANDGTPSLIARAESFANLADSISNPVVAALTYRQAWASAYAATN